MHMSTEQLALKQKELETWSPQQIIACAAETYGDQLAVVTSFQITGVATLHMLHEIAPRTAVFTLDTGLLFPETYALIDELEARLKLNLHRVRPAQSVQEQGRSYGDNLWEHNPDLCCHLRKTLPLRDALQGYGAWLTGLRRDQSPNRAQTPIVSWDSRKGMYKICPFANWTQSQVWQYIHQHKLPYNELYDFGFPSIGCWPCTSPVSEGEDLRSGRWSGSQKTECGIHLDRTPPSSQD